MYWYAIQAKQPKRPHPSATPTHTNPRSTSFTPRLSSTPQAPRPHMAKKIRITKSHDRPITSASSAAVKRFSKSVDVSSFPTKLQLPSKDEGDEYEDVGGDDLGMDWGGCDDDNWEYGDTGEGVRGGGCDSERSGPADDVPGAGAARWGTGIGGSSEGAMVVEKEEEEHKEEPMMETVVYVYITCCIRP